MTFNRLHLIMGLQCNVRCIMCYQNDFSKKFNMPPEIYREHLAPLYPYIKMVKLQGGEPTIMQNCAEFCQITEAYPDMKLAITTNGLVLSDFWLETLAARGAHVNVSLNAASPETHGRIVKHGDYHKVIANLKKLVKRVNPANTRITLSMVILPTNMLEIADFARLALDLGAAQVNFGLDPLLSFVSSPPRDKIHAVLDRAFELLEQSGIATEGLPPFARRVGYGGQGEIAAPDLPRCSMPFKSLVVDEKGDLRVCCATWRVLGNTYQQGVMDIVKGRPVRDFQKRMARDNYLWCDPKCPDNASPHKLALVDKHLYLARRDPGAYVEKVRHKLKKSSQVKSS